MFYSKSFYANFLIIVLLIVSARAFLTEQYKKNVREGRSWRLPNTSYPLEYHLHITTWIQSKILEFDANVTIELMVEHTTSELVLHARDLKIQSIVVLDRTTKEYSRNLKFRIIDDLLVIQANPHDIFFAGHLLRLEIVYSSAINKDNFGFRLLESENETNKEILAAYTHMEATEARKVLPCYDEPGLKANFSVRITHGSKYTAISNMPAISTQKIGPYDMTTTTFMQTPKMSTYLLALFVSNFKFISKESDGILHRVFRPTNAKTRGELALEISVKAIQTFGRYMNIPYSLSKIDHVDIRSFPYGGMENWGLIMYTSNAFVKTNDFDEIITENHEIAHQWFGNLVTPIWWDSLWLNEAFATYYSYKLTDMLYPELNAMERFESDNCYLDIQEQVIEYVEKPDAILGKFDESTYRKGSCLLHLLNIIIGEKTFLRGVQNYLKAHAYSNVNSDLFFQHLQFAIDTSNGASLKVNISEVMKPYFTRRVEPALNIYRNYSDSNQILIKQKCRESPCKPTELWWIPLRFAKENEKLPQSIHIIIPPNSETKLNLLQFNFILSESDVLTVSIPGIHDYEVAYEYFNYKTNDG